MLFPPEADCIGSIHAQLEHLAKIKEGTVFSSSGQKLTREQLSTLIETAFWAGLRSDEGRTTHVRLAVAAPEQVPGPVPFTSPVAYEESAIVKLAPAVPLGRCLGIALANGKLQIWGFAHGSAVKALDTVTIEIAEPGTVRVDVGPFRPYAVLDGRSNEVIAATGSDLAHYLKQILAKAFPADDFLETQAVWRECRAFADLVRMILSNGHGGAVLIVPGESGEWARLLNPFAYRLKSPDTSVGEVIRKDIAEQRASAQVIHELSQMDFPDELKSRIFAAFPQHNRDGETAVIREIASFAGVDGAVVMTRDLKLLGFGAKIEFTPGSDVQVCKFQARPGAQKVFPCRLEDLGGMRHQSGARFIAENKDAVAIIVSQDRHVSLMNWDEKLKSVRVIRNAEWWI